MPPARQALVIAIVLVEGRINGAGVWHERRALASAGAFGDSPICRAISPPGPEPAGTSIGLRQATISRLERGEGETKLGTLLDALIAQCDESWLNRDFDVFDPSCRFTDDTVCTLAVDEALKGDRDFAAALRAFVRRHPQRGYGGTFVKWGLRGRRARLWKLGQWRAGAR